MIGVEFEEVLRGAQSGDSRALARLYSDAVPRVLGYFRAQRVVDAEDVTAEVFVSMVRNIESFSGDEDDFRGWLFTIAQRRLIDDRRRRGRRPEDSLPDEDLAKSLEAVSPAERDAMERLRAGGIIDVIDSLTPDQRSVLYLRAVADLTVPEIARILDKPESAVKALLRRATAAMERKLPGYA